MDSTLVRGPAPLFVIFELTQIKTELMLEIESDPLQIEIKPSQIETKPSQIETKLLKSRPECHRVSLDLQLF